VGYWSAVGASNLSEIQTISAWADERGITGVVWAALEPKFRDEHRTPSCDEVIQYLLSFSAKVKARAEKYVRRAPAQVRTAYRERMEAELGWHPRPISPCKPEPRRQR
jgi:hypothetical protein